MPSDGPGSGSRGTISLAVATYSAAGVGLLTSALLTRSMAAEDFGSYRFIIAVIGLAAIVANLGLPYSAARELSQRPPDEHPRIVAASIQLILAPTVAVALLLAGFALFTRSFLAVAPLLLIAAALLWTTVLQRHFMYMLRGAGRPREIAIQTLLPPALTLLGVGLLSLGKSELGLHDVVGMIAASYLATHVWTSLRFGAWCQRRLLPERSTLLRRQRRTGLPIYQGALVSVGVAETVVVLGGATVGTDAFGQFALALSLAAPVATLPTVIGMVQFRRFGAHAKMTKALLGATARRSALLGTIIVALGWYAFLVIFPEGYADARLMFPLLAAALLAHGLGDYLNQYLQAKGEGLRIKRAAYGVGAANIVVGAIAIPLFGMWGLAATRALASAAYASSMLILTRRWNRAA